MTEVTIYTKPWCPYCGRAVNLLNRKGIQYREIDVSANPHLENEMIERSQAHTVPQVFFGDLHIGGSDDLLSAEESGHLDRLLEERHEPVSTS